MKPAMFRPLAIFSATRRILTQTLRYILEMSVTVGDRLNGIAVAALILFSLTSR